MKVATSPHFSRYSKTRASTPTPPSLATSALTRGEPSPHSSGLTDLIGRIRRTEDPRASQWNRRQCHNRSRSAACSKFVERINAFKRDDNFNRNILAPERNSPLHRHSRLRRRRNRHDSPDDQRHPVQHDGFGDIPCRRDGDVRDTDRR